MLEDENPTPPTAISNPALAEDMAYAEKPYRELEIHAKELGVEHVANQRDVQAAEAAKSIVEGYKSDHASLAEVQASEPASLEVPSPEKIISPERLSEMMRNAAVGTHSWMTAREIPREKKDTIGGSFMTVGTSSRVRELTESVLRVPDVVGLSEQFAAQNVSEIVTTQETTWNTKDIKTETTKPTEPVVVVTYQTANQRDGNRSATKYSQPSAQGNTGNSMTTCLFMPKSDAEELLTAIQTDPSIIRDAVDMAMRQEMEASTTWDQMKPPYDTWREENGGVDRIALRTSFEVGPNQAQILEF